MAKYKPRILRIINRLNLGGPTFNAAYLSKYLEPEFETLLLSGMKDEAEASSEFIVNELGLKPVYLPEMYRELNPFRDYKSYFRIKEIIKDFKPDIVHTHAAKAGAVGRLAAYHSGVKSIVHTYHGHVFHGYFSPAKTRFYLEIERYLAQRTTKIVTLSKKQKQELVHDFSIAPEEKFQIIPLGFDLSRFTENQNEKRTLFRAQCGIKDDEVAIGIVGRLVPIKNHSFFLQAIHKLKNSTKAKFKVIIIGDGEARLTLESEARTLGLIFENPNPSQNELVFTGWRTDVDVCNAGLDIICLTSKNEGTPVSLIEAQAAGKPIVSTRVGGIEDIVKEGESALLSDNGDLSAISHNLKLLVESGDKRRKMSGAGRDYVLKEFSYQRLCTDMATLYHSLLAQ